MRRGERVGLEGGLGLGFRRGLPLPLPLGLCVCCGWGFGSNADHGLIRKEGLDLGSIEDGKAIRLVFILPKKNKQIRWAAGRGLSFS
jgi:hypothetical protein